MDVHTANLLLHDAGVNLTHVTATIRLLDLSDVQLPRSMIVMRDAYSGIVRHHLVVKSQDGLILGLHPANLSNSE
jgi:hypothetical protein